MKLFVIFVVFALFTGCSAKPYVVQSSAKYAGSGVYEIYIVSHGWHTGLVIPSRDVYSNIPELNARFGKAQYIEFGWGDKGFYQAKEITSGLTMRAILWPTESVVHVVAIPLDVYEYFQGSEIKNAYLNRRELESLVRFISNSFYKDEHGKVLELKSGIYGDSQFYKGTGNYHLMNTCNKWTAKGLRSAGMDISTTFKLTAGSIMEYLGRKEFSPNKIEP